MPKNDTEKTLRTISAKSTKGFGRLVKTLSKDISKGRANVAFVAGFMDSATGLIRSWDSIHESHIADYSRGWDAAGGRTYTFKNGRMKRKKS